MNIGEASRKSGISAKMIRYYEDVGLLPRARRTAAGYRHYQQQDIHILRFIRQTRNLGFSMPKIRQLLALWQNKRRKSSAVKAIAQEHIRELDALLENLGQIRRTLSHLAAHCQGDNRPECPILEGLEEITIGEMTPEPPPG